MYQYRNISTTATSNPQKHCFSDIAKAKCLLYFKQLLQTELNGTGFGSVCTIIKKRSNMIRRQEPEEPAWAKYITEDNLPTEDLQYLCSIIGSDATKKLMFKAAGEKFSIHAHCNQPYKRQYIIDNFDGTKQCINKLVLECKTTQRFVYKVLEERGKVKRDK